MIEPIVLGVLYKNDVAGFEPVIPRRECES